MTRRSPKKSNRSKAAFFELPPELKFQRRQIGQFLEETVEKCPELPPGCNCLITRVHPVLMNELIRRNRAFFRTKRAQQR